MGKRLRSELTIDVAVAVLLLLVGEWRLVRWRRNSTLVFLNRKVSGNLRQKLASIAIRQLRRFLLDLAYIALTLWFIVLLVNEAQNWPYGSLVAPVLYGIAFFASYLAIPGVYIWIRLHNAETIIPLRLMSSLSYLDKRSNLREWSLRDRGKLNRRVEQLARLYELLGPALRPGDPVTAAEYQRWSRGLGARMRELKLWMLRPSPTTYTDIVSRLSEDSEMVLASRWDRLTFVDPGGLAPQPSRLSRLAWGQLGCPL